MAGKKHLFIHFLPRLFYLSTKNARAYSVGIGHQSAYFWAEIIYIDRNISSEVFDNWTTYLKVFGLIHLTDKNTSKLTSVFHTLDKEENMFCLNRTY